MVSDRLMYPQIPVLCREEPQLRRSRHVVIDGEQVSILGMHGEIGIVLITHVTEALETMSIRAAPYADLLILLVSHQP